MQQPTPRLSATLALEEYRSRLGAVLNLLEDAAHGRLEFPTESEELVKTLDGLVDYLLAGEASVMSTREALAQHNKQYEELQALQAQADEAYADVVVAALDAEAALSRLAERHCEAETRAAVIRAVADATPISLDDTIVAAERWSIMRPSHDFPRAPFMIDLQMLLPRELMNRYFPEDTVTAAALEAVAGSLGAGLEGARAGGAGAAEQASVPAAAAPTVAEAAAPAPQPQQQAAAAAAAPPPSAAAPAGAAGGASLSAAKLAALLASLTPELKARLVALLPPGWRPGQPLPAALSSVIASIKSKVATGGGAGAP